MKLVEIDIHAKLAFMYDKTNILEMLRTLARTFQQSIHVLKAEFLQNS
jgi:hypothetical protein